MLHGASDVRFGPPAQISASFISSTGTNRDHFLQAELPITNRRHPDHLAMERLRSAVNSSAHKDAFRPLDTRTLLAVTIARALRLEVDSHSHGDLVACEHH